jgi:hypothetical protein
VNLVPDSGKRCTLQPGTLERGVCLMIEDDAVKKGQLAP